MLHLLPGAGNNLEDLAEAAPLVRFLRAYHGLSQRKLAQAAGLHPQKLWRWENGVNAPRPDEAARVLKILLRPGEPVVAVPGISGNRHRPGAAR